jgi:hypothetical protein
MSIRIAKQLIYGALYILILLAITAGIYFVLIRPFVMAGAPAACTPSSCAPTSTASILAGPVLIFTTSPGHYTFLAQATNQNADYGAPELGYVINLDDASGTVLRSIPAQTFIYQSQSKYLAVLNQAVNEPFDHATLVITDASWLASSTLGVIAGIAPGQFAVQNVQSAVASTTVSVGGQLINTGVATYGKAIILVIFNDPNGNPIGVSQTELDNIAAGSTNTFSVIYPNEANINPALNHIAVYAIR